MSDDFSSGVLIVGTGAQAKYALEIFRLRAVPVIGLIAAAATGADSLDDAPVLGGLDKLDGIIAAHPRSYFLLACRSSALKRQLAERLAGRVPGYARAIHPAAIIARTATIGNGSIVNPTAVVQPFAAVGQHAMIHAGVIVEHDVRIGDFANIAPRACLTGHVVVGAGATVFAGAVVAPTVTIGDGAIVGAGAVVLHPVAPGATVVGVPARQLRGHDVAEGT